MAQAKKIQARISNNDSELQGIRLMEEEVYKKLVNPQDSSYCSCNICHAKYQLKQLGATFVQQTNSSMKIQSNKIQQFFTFISSINPKQCLKLDIPEICFFSKGQPRKFFKSNNLGVQKIDLTSTLKGNLMAMFLENKKNHQLEATSSEVMDLSPNQNIHIKLFDEMVPSFRHGDLHENHPKNFIFHNNSKLNDGGFGQRGSNQQICIIKYKEKVCELITEKQLRNILKSLLSLQNVEYIQTYIKPTDQDAQIVQANYDHTKRNQNPLMINRSLVQVKIDVNLINKFSKDYISTEHLDKYQMEVLKDIPSEFCLYQTFKMVHYMQLMKDVFIEKLNTLWLLESTGEVYFYGLVNFQWKEKEKLSVDIDQLEELKQLTASSLSSFEMELMHTWENMKISKRKKDEGTISMDEQRENKLEEVRKQSRLRKEREEKKKIHK